MNCLDIQRQMAAGESDRRAPAVQAHVEHCDDCRAARDREIRLDRLLDVARAEQPDAHFEDRLVARLRADIANGRPSPLFWTPARTWAAGLSALAALLLITAAPLRPRESSGPEISPLAAADDVPRLSPASWDAASAVHPIFGSSAADHPNARPLFVSGLGAESPAATFTGLTLKGMPGPESPLLLASTNLPVRLGPGNIRYGGDSFMVDFGGTN